MENYHFDQNICWDCQKACGGCSWSKSLTPVDGWEAEEVPYQMWFSGSSQQCTTYHITKCPEFLADEPRKVDNSILTQEENAAFIKGKRFPKLIAGYTKHE